MSGRHATRARRRQRSTSWHTPWRRDFPVLCWLMALWLSGSSGLRYYADVTLLGEGSVYAAVAAPLVVLLWLYVTAFAVLLGAELNAEIVKLWPHPATQRKVSSGTVTAGSGWTQP